MSEKFWEMALADSIVTVEITTPVDSPVGTRLLSHNLGILTAMALPIVTLPSPGRKRPIFAQRKVNWTVTAPPTRPLWVTAFSNW